jgi:hypothetical protein
MSQIMSVPGIVCMAVPTGRLMPSGRIMSQIMSVLMSQIMSVPAHARAQRGLHGRRLV